MLAIQFLLLFAALVSSCSSTVVDGDMSTLLLRMATLEEKVSKQVDLEHRIELLEAEMTKKDQQIAELRQQCDGISQVHHTLPDHIENADKNTDGIDKEINNEGSPRAAPIHAADDDTVVKPATMASFVDQTNQNVSNHQLLGKLRRRKTNRSSRSIKRADKRSIIEKPVAFTANIDVPGGHLNHLGVGQVIKFNKLLTNLGGAYNVHSGIFTAPVEGVYLFSFVFSVGWEVEHVGIRLMIDDVPQVGGVAQNTQSGMDEQGGNLAVVHLQPGQVAWIESFHNSDVHLYTANGYDSFSGVLLYQF